MTKDIISRFDPATKKIHLILSVEQFSSLKAAISSGSIMAEQLDVERKRKKILIEKKAIQEKDLLSWYVNRVSFLTETVEEFNRHCSAIIELIFALKIDNSTKI